MPSPVDSYSDRLAAAVRTRGSRLVIGMDPRVESLPDELKAGVLPHAASCGGPGLLDAAARAVRKFDAAILDAAEESAAAVKPQWACYERLGLPGLEALAGTLADARKRGVLVIGDAKRGDIASTAESYAEAFLGPGPDGLSKGAGPAPWRVDALTVNPFLGSDAVVPFVRAAVSNGAGIYVLVRTSNPGADDLQALRLEGGGTVSERLAELVDRWGSESVGGCGYSSVGAVVGATTPAITARLRQMLPRTPFLVPGFGAQGAGPDEIRPAFDRQGGGAVVVAARSVIYAFARKTAGAVTQDPDWRGAIRAAARSTRDAIEKAVAAGR